MTREQKLFEAARDFVQYASTQEYIGFSKQFLDDLEAAVSAYEGVAFSDGQEQDISPDAPHYNPKISGRL